MADRSSCRDSGLDLGICFRRRWFIVVLASLAQLPSALARDPMVFESVDGWLNVTLRVEVLTWRIPFKGISFQTRAYNGIVPGPLLRASPGDRVRLLVQNRLGDNLPGQGCNAPKAHYRGANSTNLHIHGIYDSPLHDNTFLCMNPGEDHLYEYTIDKRTGTSHLWYHPHFDGSSGMQLYGGMYGAFEIIDKDQDHMFDFVETRNVLLQFLSFNASLKKDKHGVSDFVEAFLSYGGVSTLPINLHNPQNYTGNLLLANGKFEPNCSCNVGEHIRLNLVNALSGATMVMLNIGFLSGNEECKIATLAYDGVYLSAPRAQSSIRLPAGGRADIAISCSKAGSFKLGTIPYGIEELGNSFPDGHTILNLHVKDAPAEHSVVLPRKLPGPPSYYADLQNVKPDGHNVVLLSDAQGSNSVNGWPYNGSVSYTMPHLSIQEWQILGGEGSGLLKIHPYHQHMTHFQIIGIHGDPAGLVASIGDYRDTVPIYRDLNFTVRFVAPFFGLMMIHCHILKHEDMGMMTLANVTIASPALLV